MPPVFLDILYQKHTFESTLQLSQSEEKTNKWALLEASTYRGGGRWIRRQLSDAKIAYIVEKSPLFPEKAQDVVREIYIFYCVVFYNG